MANLNVQIKNNDIEKSLGIELVRMDDGTTILKMGNNTYEDSIVFSNSLAANR